MSNMSISSAFYADSQYVSGVMNPVLAKLYRDHGICDGAIQTLPQEERAGLCEDVAELIEISSRPSDREMASDILLSLLRHAELHLKQAVAERFSVMPQAPLRLVLQFINEDISIARPVLQNSPALNDLDLLYIIQSRDSPFWQAIAARKNLAPVVVDALLDKEDLDTSRTLIDNDTVMLSDDDVMKIAQFAKDHQVLEEALTNRSLKGGEDFARKIYAYAGESLKKALVQKFPMIAPEIMDLMDDVMSEFTEDSSMSLVPRASMLKAAELFQEQGRLGPDLMINTLKRGQTASFVAQMAKFTCMPVATVIAMLQQKDGHGLAIVARAYDCTRAQFLAMYTLTRRNLSHGNDVSYEISAALAYYDRVTPDVAKRLMRQSQN